MKIGVLKESARGERRVALVPETVKKLAQKGIGTLLQRGAGVGASFADADYAAAGAEVVATADEVLARADGIVAVAKPEPELLGRLREGTTLIALQFPLTDAPFVRVAEARRLTTVALDMIPRTSLAQSMDVLSSQANLAGYWAVVAAASRVPKIFPLLMTAAGTLAPARVLVMGVGVAGLQAIGTAKRLGAIVEATDVRPETKEQVESLGATFLQVEGVAYIAGTGGYAAEQSAEYRDAQARMIAAAIARNDVVITTALIPGRPAPVLVTDDQLRTMRPGSVVVDLAAEQGGNVVGSEAGADVVRHGVTIVGALSAASHVGFHASQAFSRNIEKLLVHLTRDGAWRLDRGDEITRGCLITRDGEIVHPKVRETVTGVKA